MSWTCVSHTAQRSPYLCLQHRLRPGKQESYLTAVQVSGSGTRINMLQDLRNTHNMHLSLFLLLLVVFNEMCAGMDFTDGGTEVNDASKLNARLDKLERLLHEQDAKLVRQETLLRQQDAKLSRQETLLFKYGKLIQQLRAEKVDSRSELGNRPTSDKLQQPLPDTLTTGQTQLPPAALGSDDIVTAKAHDVMSRSDDGGPLEAVVSHISQQVTEMSADIQAFKSQTSADIQTLKNSNSQQDHHIQDAQSSTFVHWGSSQCGGSSHLVYSGVVGGSYYTHSGAATNYLCLTMSPVFSNQQLPSYMAYLYGGEYETYDSHMNKDPTCTVCRSTFSTTVMIPGTNVCTPGWHLQYSGFLMAGEYDHPAGSEYICVDSQFQSRLSSDTDQDGKLLYYTVTRCGSLPCEPYVNNKVVLCAVCSK